MFFNIFYFPAMMCQRIAIFISDVVYSYISESAGEWLYLKIAFPFQTDTCFKIAVPIAFLFWGVLGYFAIRWGYHSLTFQFSVKLKH